MFSPWQSPSFLGFYGFDADTTNGYATATSIAPGVVGGFSAVVALRSFDACSAPQLLFGNAGGGAGWAIARLPDSALALNTPVNSNYAVSFLGNASANCVAAAASDVDQRMLLIGFSYDGVNITTYCNGAPVSVVPSAFTAAVGQVLRFGGPSGGGFGTTQDALLGALYAMRALSLAEMQSLFNFYRGLGSFQGAVGRMQELGVFAPEIFYDFAGTTPRLPAPSPILNGGPLQGASLVYQGTDRLTPHVDSMFASVGGGLGGGGGVYVPFTGASAVADGAEGLVPQPVIADFNAHAYLFSGGNWKQINQDEIAPGFSIASFAKTAPNAGTLLYRRGDALVGTAISATYVSGPPTSASLANVLGGVAGVGNVDPVAWVFAAPFAAGSQPANVLRNGTDGGADPTWTIELTATGTAVDTESTTITWTRDAFWGVSSLAGPLNAAQVAALAGSALDTNFVRTFVVSPANEYVYYCYPASYGPINFMKLFGIDVDLQPVYTVAGVASGIPSTYNVYRTTNLLIGANLNFVVT